MTCRVPKFRGLSMLSGKNGIVILITVKVGFIAIIKPIVSVEIRVK